MKITKGKTAVFIDYANIKAWAKEKGLTFDLEVLYQYLKNLGAEKIIFYYGTDPKNPRSHAFLLKVRQIGFEVVTKPVKYIKVGLLSLFQQRGNREALTKLSPVIQKAIFKQLEQPRKKQIKILLPKANFDAEMTLDMVLFEKSFDSFIIFSGDSDLLVITKYLRSKNKRVAVAAGKKYLAGELIGEANNIVRLERLVKKVKGLVKKLPPKTPDEPGKKSKYYIAQKKKVVKRQNGNN
ncbi:MAG: NYN domain-containing protein [Microgenomates group bacterium]